MKPLKISTISQTGEIAGEQGVSASIFAVESSSALIGQAVKSFLSNQRKAGARAKTRSEVIGTTVKVWRQKGTGRARHGSRKAPIFVGGGAAHGPTGEQNYKQKLNRKMSQKAIFSILSKKLSEKKLFLLDDIAFKKTKEASLFLQATRKTLKTESKITFLLAGSENLERYLSNLGDVFILGVKSLNAYSLLKTDFLFLTKQALEELEKTGNTKEKEKN